MKIRSCECDLEFLVLDLWTLTSETNMDVCRSRTFSQIWASEDRVTLWATFTAPYVFLFTNVWISRTCLIYKRASSREKGPDVIRHHFAYRPVEANRCYALHMQWHISERPYHNLFRQFSKQFFWLELYVFPEIEKVCPKMALGPLSHAPAQVSEDRERKTLNRTQSSVFLFEIFTLFFGLSTVYGVGEPLLKLIKSVIVLNTRNYSTFRQTASSGTCHRSGTISRLFTCSLLWNSLPSSVGHPVTYSNFRSSLCSYMTGFPVSRPS